MSKSLINSNLRRQVSNLVDSTESATKITKLPNNNVKVNRRLVSKMRNLYTISDSKETFYLKKSAIGYALTLEDNNYGMGFTIMRLDHNIGKLTEDIDWYKASYVRTQDTNRRTTLYNRISAVQPELETAREQLTKHLKSIKIA
jgi:hypothetical protein